MKPTQPSEGSRPTTSTTERFARPGAEAWRTAIEAALSTCRAAETAARRKDRDHRFGR